MAVKFVVEIDTANDAFQPAPGEELARILRELADQVEVNVQGANLCDSNGNKCGYARAYSVVTYK